MSLALETNALSGEAEVRRIRRVTLVWMGTMILLFPLLIALGYYMRMFQAKMFPTIRPEWFYAVLTLHGIGMVGNWYIGGRALPCHAQWFIGGETSTVFPRCSCLSERL